MKLQAVPDDGHNLSYLCNQEVQLDLAHGIQSFRNRISGSIFLAQSMISFNVDRIFCQKGITHTDLVTTLDAHGIRIIAFPSLDSVHSAASHASRTGHPSIILSSDGHSYNLKIIVPLVSSRPDLFVLARLSHCKEVVSIDEIPRRLVRVLYDAMSSGIELNLNISPDVLSQTVSDLQADFLISSAQKPLMYKALLQERTNFLSRSQTAGGDFGGLQLLSTAAPLQEIEVSLPAPALTSARMLKLAKVEKMNSSGLEVWSAADSTSQAARSPVWLPVKPLTPALDDIAFQQSLYRTCDLPLPPFNRDFDLPTGTTAKSGGPNSTNHLGCFHDAWLWVLRRNKQEAKYSAQIEQEVYGEDVFCKQGLAFAGLGVAIVGINQPDELAALKPFLPFLYFLLLTSMVFTGIGRSLKTTFPEASVLAMIISKALVLASFFAPILHLLPNDSAWLWIVYLTIAYLACTFLATIGYSLWKDDVREPQEVEIDAMV